MDRIREGARIEGGTVARFRLGHPLPCGLFTVSTFSPHPLDTSHSRGTMGARWRRACAMRCLACGAEMFVEHVAPDDTMPVSGYEYRTLRCPECGDTERRLVFAGDRASAESTSVEATAPAIEATISIVDATNSVETANSVVEATSAEIKNSVIETANSLETANSVVETTRSVQATNPVVESASPVAPTARGQDQPRVAPDAGPVATWAQTVEKVRTRHTALTQASAARAAASRNSESTATRSNEPAATKNKEAADDFDLMWESPVPPRQPPQARSEPSPTLRLDGRPRGTTPTPARTPPRNPGAPFSIVRSDATVAPSSPKRPAERATLLSKALQTKKTKTPQSPASQGTALQDAASQGAWARAVALVRERLDRATKRDRNDTILRIDDDALKVKPRHGQSRPSDLDSSD
jgi:hypothetical protein